MMTEPIALGVPAAADLLAWYAAQPSNHADDDRLADA